MSKSTRIAKKTLAATGTPVTPEAIQAEKEARIAALTAKVATETAKPGKKASPIASEPAPKAEQKAETKAAQRSATKDEKEALVRGELTPRGPQPSAPEGARPLGATTGLPMQLCWGYLFQQNEKRADAFAKDPKAEKPWTDEKIAAFFESEFPGREAKFTVHSARVNQNKGQATDNIPLRRKSRRYNAEGQPVEGRISPKAVVAVASSSPVAVAA